MRWTQGTIVDKRVWDDGLFTLSVRAPEVAKFEAGQFLQLGIELPEGHLHRPYSVASPHGATLEFFVVLVEDGRLTPKLWRLKPGDRLDVSEKAAGSFTLSNCPQAKTLWLISTGTGLAPYIAMLRSGELWKSYDRVVVVQGVRHERDLAYRQELEAVQARFAGRFCYAPVVSREIVARALTGRITTCIQNGSLEEMAGEAFSEGCCVMLCGNPDMLDEVEALLVEQGLARHKRNQAGNIVVERYW